MGIDLKAIEKAAHDAPKPAVGQGRRKPRIKLGEAEIGPKHVVRYLAWACASIRAMAPDAREKALRKVLIKVNPTWGDKTGKTGPKPETVRGWASAAIRADGGEVNAKGRRKGPEAFLSESQRVSLLEVAHALGVK